MNLFYYLLFILSTKQTEQSLQHLTVNLLYEYFFFVSQLFFLFVIKNVECLGLGIGRKKVIINAVVKIIKKNGEETNDFEAAFLAYKNSKSLKKSS